MGLLQKEAQERIDLALQWREGQVLPFFSENFDDLSFSDLKEALEEKSEETAESGSRRDLEMETDELFSQYRSAKYRYASRKWLQRLGLKQKIHKGGYNVGVSEILERNIP